MIDGIYSQIMAHDMAEKILFIMLISPPLQVLQALLLLLISSQNLHSKPSTGFYRF